MAWRVIQISKPCLLKVKNRQLVYVPQNDNKEEKGEEISIPLEDISVLILEHRQITLYNSLLADLAEYGICLFSCDDKHIPCGSYFPFHQHFHYAHISTLQITMSLPLKKRLWQEVVKAKIRNQALCLEALGIFEHTKLVEMAKKVQSGDSSNVESSAANFYFKYLFADFTRQNEEDCRNEYLNYSYAILRACMARALVGAGLMPFYGLHHANKLNAYNLADDMMEVFRPFADYLVKTMVMEYSENNEKKLQNLNPKIKQKLLSLLTKQCSIVGEVRGLLPAFETVANSLVKAIEKKNYQELTLPIFMKEHF